MRDPSVSVIIPTFNRREFVLEAVRSVLEQTFEPLELIVVDDGSTDGTADALRGLGDRRLRVIEQKNRGVSAARNAGVAVSRAPLVAFLDSDDLWLPQKLQVQTAYMDANPDISICQTEELWLRRGRRVNPKSKHRKRSGWIFEDCLPLCIVSPSATMMRRLAFDALGGFDEGLLACEDYDLWLRASLRYQISTLSEPLIVKRGGRPDQLSAQWGLDMHRIAALEKIMEDPLLSEERRRLVLAEIKRRSRIVSAGARKRLNTALSRDYASKADLLG